MKIIEAREGLYYLATDGRDYLLDVNGAYTCETFKLTQHEVTAYLAEGRAYVEGLARRFSSSSREAMARRTAQRIPPSLIRAWRIDHGLPVHNVTTGKWEVIAPPADQ